MNGEKQLEDIIEEAMDTGFKMGKKLALMTLEGDLREKDEQIKLLKEIIKKQNNE